MSGTPIPTHTLDSPEMSALLAAGLAVFNIGPDHVVALDEDDAWAVWCEHYSERREDYAGEPCTWLPGGQALTIFVDESGAISDTGKALTLTAAEWCAREGRGFLCSTEF